jgi:hypothetical protein
LAPGYEEARNIQETLNNEESFARSWQQRRCAPKIDQKNVRTKPIEVSTAAPGSEYGREAGGESGERPED